MDEESDSDFCNSGKFLFFKIVYFLDSILVGNVSAPPGLSQFGDSNGTKTDGASIKDNTSKFLLSNEIIFLDVYESIMAEAPLGHKQSDSIGDRIDEVSKDKDGIFFVYIIISGKGT